MNVIAVNTKKTAASGAKNRLVTRKPSEIGATMSPPSEDLSTVRVSSSAITAIVNDGDAITGLVGLLDIVGRQDDRDAHLLVHPLDALPD